MDFANQKIMSLELENKMLKARVEELHQNMLGKKHRRARTLSICTPKYAAESPTSTYSVSEVDHLEESRQRHFQFYSNEAY
jgi:hypothetical protein